MPPGNVTYRASALLRNVRTTIDFSVGDELLIRALYDPRLAAGMTGTDTSPRLPEIMQDLVDRLHEGGFAAVNQR